MEVQKPRKLNWQWVLIPDSAKSTVCFFFPLTAQLPNQDESSDDQTHLGAAQTQILCLIIHGSNM